MPQVIIDKPYRFVPPYHGRLWAWLLRLYLPRYLRGSFGIVDVQCRQTQRLVESLGAGHGILLAPNHCRESDPIVMAALARQAGTHLFTMASWHLFMQSRLKRWLIRRGGAFSVYREGTDRSAMNAAIDILQHARRPLVVFPEGFINRTNERLSPLMDGVAFMARQAAKRRAADLPDAKVIIHPIAIRYLYDAPLDEALAPVLDQIESRLSWRPQRQLPLTDRVVKLGFALLGLKELEYFGHTHEGEVALRLKRLIDHLLTPIEAQWLAGRSDKGTIARVKRLRTAIVADMTQAEPADKPHDEHWRQLDDIELALKLAHYPADYIRARPTVERLLETVERFEHDLFDQLTIHRPMRVVIEVGEAIDLPTKRQRGSAEDPITAAIDDQLTAMLASLSDELTHALAADPGT